MISIFFTKFWHVIGKDTVATIHRFFHYGFLLKAVNETIISFIAKTEHPINLSHFRPINLCNVLYKAISKLLANRFKLILFSCISKNQPVFVSGKQILDNAILTHKFLHFFKHKKGIRKVT